MASNGQNPFHEVEEEWEFFPDEDMEEGSPASNHEEEMPATEPLRTSSPTPSEIGEEFQERRSAIVGILQPFWPVIRRAIRRNFGFGDALIDAYNAAREEAQNELRMEPCGSPECSGRRWENLGVPNCQRGWLPDGLGK